MFKRSSHTYTLPFSTPSSVDGPRAVGMRPLILVVSILGGMLACQTSEQEAQREAREEALQDFEETSDASVPCRLTGRWNVEETVNGGTCEAAERLASSSLVIDITDGDSLSISVTRGESVFEQCSGTRALEGCALDVTCSPAEGDDLSSSLELAVSSDGQLEGRQILTYRDGEDFCNVEIGLRGARAAEPSSR